jgi:hypothetical protein
MTVSNACELDQQQGLEPMISTGMKACSSSYVKVIAAGKPWLVTG